MTKSARPVQAYTDNNVLRALPTIVSSANRTCEERTCTSEAAPAAIAKTILQTIGRTQSIPQLVPSPIHGLLPTPRLQGPSEALPVTTIGQHQMWPAYTPEERAARTAEVLAGLQPGEQPGIGCFFQFDYNRPRYHRPGSSPTDNSPPHSPVHCTGSGPPSPSPLNSTPPPPKPTFNPPPDPLNTVDCPHSLPPTEFPPFSPEHPSLSPVHHLTPSSPKADAEPSSPPTSPPNPPPPPPKPTLNLPPDPLNTVDCPHSLPPIEFPPFPSEHPSPPPPHHPTPLTTEAAAEPTSPPLPQPSHPQSQPRPVVATTSGPGLALPPSPDRTPPPSTPPSSPPPSPPRPSNAPSGEDWTFLDGLELPEAFHLEKPRGKMHTVIPPQAIGAVRSALMGPLKKIAGDPHSSSAWKAFLLFPQWCLRVSGKSNSQAREALKHRCQRFRTGDFRGLHEDYLTSLSASSSERQPPIRTYSAGDDVDNCKARAVRLARVGEMSRAMRALTPAPSAPFSDDTLQALRDLHPPSDPAHNLPSWIADFSPPAPFVLGYESFRLALQRSPKLSAAGPSGMSFELLKAACSPAFVDGHKALFKVVSHIAAGSVPPEVATFLAASRLSALHKPNGGVRPVAIGESLMRLGGKALCLQLRQALQDRLKPHQLGVATPAGCETTVLALRALREIKPEWGILQIDVANAFNTVSRSAIFEDLREAGGSLEALIPYCRAFYANPSPLLYSNLSPPYGCHVLSSTNGTRQGDPLGGPLFALAHSRAIRAVAQEFPQLLFPSIADDTHVVGPPELLRQALPSLEAHFLRIGLRVNRGKCRFLPGMSIPLESIPEITTVQDGINCLGSPVGSEVFVQEHVTKALDGHLRGTELLSSLRDSQVALLLLSKTVAVRPGYLCRTTPPSEPFLSLLHSFDDKVLNVLEDILSAGLTKAASIQASLPISMGGLGLVPNALIANAAFWGSWSTSASLLSSHFTVSSTPPSTQPLDPLAPSRDFPLLKPFLTSVVEDSTFPLHRHLALSRSSLPQSYLAEAPTFNSVAISPALKEQHKASVALLSQRRRTLSQDLPLACRARLLSSSGRASGAWLHAQPMGGQLAMFQAIHLTAVRLRLGLPHPGKRADAKCACGRTIGPKLSTLYSAPYPHPLAMPRPLLFKKSPPWRIWRASPPLMAFLDSSKANLCP